MIAKTEAITLCIRPYSRTSHVVTWMTRDFGRVTTAVKGACRVKSAFLGQYDLCYTCQLLFYERSHNGVHAIRECSPLKFREPLHNNWRAAAAATYLVDLTARLTISESAREIFNDLTHALDTLCTCDNSSIPALIFWYEMCLLRHHGIAPDFTECPQCAPFQTDWLRFSVPAGKIICRHHDPRNNHEPCITLHKDVVRVLRRFGKCGNFKACQYRPMLHIRNKKEKNNNLILGLSRFLGIFIVFHLDVPIFVRRTTFEILNSQSALS
jgi:DNA repair protein RecO (recombination protein O)